MVAEGCHRKAVAMGKILTGTAFRHCDEDSFQEYDMFVEHDARDFDMGKRSLPEMVLCGTGSISGRPVCIFAKDFTVAGGSLGSMHSRKIVKIMDHALKLKMPLIGINDSGGARIQEGVNSLAGYGEIFFRNTLSSGVIPQISVILGPCAGGAVYSPALTDFVFVVENISKMFITGPEVIKTVLGEEISMEDLGGARIHSEITGNAHFYARTEIECFDQIKRLLTFIPWSNEHKALMLEPGLPHPEFKAGEVMPDDPKHPYDVRDVIKSVVDESAFFEYRNSGLPIWSSASDGWEERLVDLFAISRLCWPVCSMWIHPTKLPALSGIATPLIFLLLHWLTCPATCPG
jgi:acetyl-CoA carboxylase carboxyltransferase component